MEKKKKERAGWDPVRKLTGQYQAKMKAVYQEIDELARTGRSGKVITPNYAKEVISPLTKALEEKLTRIKITVSEKVEVFNSKDAYFKVMVGEHTLGGFSYPGPGVNQIHFTVFAHEKPWGKVIKVTKLCQLADTILQWVDFLELDKNLREDV